VEIKPVSVVKNVIFAKVVSRTYIERGGQYISHIVGNLFRCHCAKNYRNWL